MILTPTWRLIESNRFSISFKRFCSAMKSLFSMTRVFSSRASWQSAVWRTSETLYVFYEWHGRWTHMNIWIFCMIQRFQLTCFRKRSRTRLIFSSRRFAADSSFSLICSSSRALCCSSMVLFLLISSVWTCWMSNMSMKIIMRNFVTKQKCFQLTLIFSSLSDMMASRFSSLCSIFATNVSFALSINSWLSSVFFLEASSIFINFAFQIDTFWASWFCEWFDEMFRELVIK